LWRRLRCSLATASPQKWSRLIVLATLLLSGLVPVEKGLRGFSNDAVITIAAMFVLSEGLQRTGVIGWLARGLEWLARQAAWLSVVALLLLNGVFVGVCEQHGGGCAVYPAHARAFRKQRVKAPHACCCPSRMPRCWVGSVR
jgi:hypothetical protein